MSSASSRTASRPWRSASIAALRPAGPAPMMTMSKSALRHRLCRAAQPELAQEARDAVFAPDLKARDLQWIVTQCRRQRYGARRRRRGSPLCPRRQPPDRRAVRRGRRMWRSASSRIASRSARDSSISCFATSSETSGRERWVRVCDPNSMPFSCIDRTESRESIGRPIVGSVAVPVIVPPEVAR